MAQGSDWGGEEHMKHMCGGGMMGMGMGMGMMKMNKEMKKEFIMALLDKKEKKMKAEMDFISKMKELAKNTDMEEIEEK